MIQCKFQQSGRPHEVGRHNPSLFEQALGTMEDPTDQTFFGCPYRTILLGIRRPNSMRFCLALGRQEMKKLYDDQWVYQCLKELKETENVRLSTRTVLIKLKRNRTITWFGSARDAIAFLALSAACFPAVYRSSQRIQPDVEFSGPLLSDVSRFSWGEKDTFRHYARRFARETRRRLRGDYRRVLINDIKRCAGSIDVNRLLNELEKWGAPSEVLVRLRSLYADWSAQAGPGIPHGSEFWLLLRCYLAETDLRLVQQGVSFIRQGDEYRIFLKSDAEALPMTRLLRTELKKVGLTLNESKEQLGGGVGFLAKTFFIVLHPRTLTAYRLFPRLLARCVKFRLLRPVFIHLSPIEEYLGRIDDQTRLGKIEPADRLG